MKKYNCVSGEHDSQQLLTNNHSKLLSNGISRQKNAIISVFYQENMNYQEQHVHIMTFQEFQNKAINNTSSKNPRATVEGSVPGKHEI